MHRLPQGRSHQNALLGVGVVAGALMSAYGSAQSGQAITSIFNNLHRSGQVDVPPNKQPTALVGFPMKEESHQGTLPTPTPTKNPNAFELKNQGGLHQDGDEIYAEGPLELHYRGYKVFADFLQGNRRSDVYIFRGHVILIGQDGVVKGSTITAHFKSNFYAASDEDADIKPGATNNYLLSDLFIKSGESYGTPSEQFNRMMRVTTCEYERPHYELDAKTGSVRPHRRVILRDVDLIIKDRKIFHLPIVVIPLNEPPDRYIPDFGNSPSEGYYVKSRWAIDLHSQNTLISRLDYMTKLGGAFGGDYSYGKGYQRNNFSFYDMPGGTKMLLLRNHHDQDFGKVKATFDNTFQKNDYLYASDTTNFSSRETFSLAQRSGMTGLTLSANSTSAPGFTSSQDNAQFTNTFQTKGLSTNSSVNYSKYDSSGSGVSSSRQQVDVGISASTDLKKASAELDYQRSIPIGVSSGFTSTADQTPMLTLRSDANRLFNAKFAQLFPVTVQASTGELVDPILGDHITRHSIDLSLNKQLPQEGRTSFGFNTRFRQGFYSDNTAQFLLAYGTQFSYAISKGSAFNFNYNYQRPQGYAPLSMDQTGITDYASSDLTLQLKAFKVGAQTGYDFTEKGSQYLTTPWQSVGVRTEYAPTKNFLVRALSSYDTTLKGWSTISSDLTYQFRQLYFGVTSLYDAQRHTWANGNINLSGLHVGKVGFEARLYYNGYLNQFQAQQYAVVYDLHDSELVFQYMQSQTGFNSGRQINLYLRLKALPFNNLFGFGSQGQAIGSGMGRSF